MTREEQIIETAKFIYSPSSGIPQSLPMRVGFIEGAKWADKTMLDKACEWLTKHLYDYDSVEGYEVFGDVKSFVNDFRKAMEE